MLQCSDGSFYTGITTNLKRRISEHNSAKTGAKYTRGRRPVFLVYKEVHPTRASACKREYAVKRLSVKEKKALAQI